MKTQKLILLVLTLVLALGVISCQAQPAPVAPQPQTQQQMPPAPVAQPQQPVAPVAYDIKPALDRYFSGLPDGFGTIAPAALKDQMAVTKMFVVDVRETSEITSAGYIEGSVNIPIRTLLKNLDKLPAKDQLIVVTCGSGHRSALGMMALQMLGYSNVKSLAGGFGAWKAANLPVATGTQPVPVAGKSPDLDLNLFAALDKYLGALPDGFGTIAPAALSDQLAASKPFQVDVREAAEITSSGYIAGSVNVPVRTLIKTLDKLPSDKAAVIITECGSGHRSALTMMALNLLGYTNVKSLAGGFTAWRAANLAAVGVPFDLKAAYDKYFTALPDGFGTIQPAAANDQMKVTKVFLLDVRETSEVATGYIQGAVNIPVRTVMKNLDKLPADKTAPIIVTCGSGFRSGFTMTALQMLGYSNVKSLAGGFAAWKAANLPVVTTGAPAAPVAGTVPTVDKDLLAALDKWFTALPDGFGGIAPAAAKDQMAATKVVLIDLREPSEITANGMIEGSLSIPVRILIKSTDKLPTDKNAPIIVTCASGHRGSFSMMALQMLGYTNVKNLSGGLGAWSSAGFAVVKSPTMN